MLIIEILSWLIPHRCEVCNKIVWWWDKKEVLEMTPDFGYITHFECGSKETYRKLLNEWFKDIGLKYEIK